MYNVWVTSCQVSNFAEYKQRNVDSVDLTRGY
jgi:hypothetical protein